MYFLETGGNKYRRKKSGILVEFVLVSNRDIFVFVLVIIRFYRTIII